MFKMNNSKKTSPQQKSTCNCTRRESGQSTSTTNPQQNCQEQIPLTHGSVKKPMKQCESVKKPEISTKPVSSKPIAIRGVSRANPKTPKVGNTLKICKSGETKATTSTNRTSEQKPKKTTLPISKIPRTIIPHACCKVNTSRGTSAATRLNPPGQSRAPLRINKTPITAVRKYNTAKATAKTPIGSAAAPNTSQISTAKSAKFITHVNANRSCPADFTDRKEQNPRQIKFVCVETTSQKIDKSPLATKDAELPKSADTLVPNANGGSPPLKSHDKVTDRSKCSNILNESNMENVKIDSISTGNTTHNSNTFNIVKALDSSINCPMQSQQPAIDFESDEKILRAVLCDKYKQLHLPNPPGLDNGKLPIGWKYVDLDLCYDQVNINLENIFDEVYTDNQKPPEIDPVRILVESPAGYGKSTLAHRIAYDWAAGAVYVKKFKFAFLLPLKTLDRAITEEILHIAKNDRLMQSEIKKMLLSHHSKDILLILDGLEELTTNMKEEVYKVLYKRELRESTVIVTCRNGMFTLTEEEKKSISGGIHMSREFYDKKITILGVSEVNRRLLLKNLVDRDDKDEVINRIEKIIKPVQDMFTCPRYVVPIAVAVDSDDFSSLKTLTGLYKRLVNFIIELNLNSCGTKSSKNFNLFDGDKTAKRIHNILYQFGKLAVSRILDGNPGMRFECEAEANEVFKMGFLTKREKTSNFVTQVYYELHHLSILEFFAAFSMWVDCKRSGNCFSNKQKGNINTIFSTKKAFSRILPFVAGLLGENSYILIDQINPSFESPNPEIDFILKDCEVNFKLVESLCKLFPEVARATEFTQIFQLLGEKFNIFSSRLNTIIRLQLNLFEKLPKHLKNKLIPSNDYENELKNTSNQKKCNMLEFHFTTSDHSPSECDMYFLLLDEASANEKISQDCRKDPNLHLIVKFIYVNLLQTPQIEANYYLASGEASTELIKFVVEQNKLERLHLKVFRENDTDDVSSQNSSSFGPQSSRWFANDSNYYDVDKVKQKNRITSESDSSKEREKPCAIL